MNDVIFVEHVWPGEGSFGLNMIKGRKDYVQIVSKTQDKEICMNFALPRLKQMIAELEAKNEVL